MSRRSGRTLALGLVALVAAWSFGSAPVAVVAVGLLLAAVGARLWARLAARVVHASRHACGEAHIEGDEVTLEVHVRASRLLPLGAVTVRQPSELLLAPAVRVRRSTGEIRLGAVPRGRYVLGPAEIELEDPLGLERVVVAAGPSLQMTVRPRVVDLPTLFADAGLREQGGRRAVLRSASGFDLHAVREYRDGEPLRAVHWPSTARRARLMVKDMDDAPREDVVVVLDQEPHAIAGRRGCSSFDAAVRAAGSLVRAHAARGRRTALLLGGAEQRVVRVRSLAHDWSSALDALAAAEPDARAPFTALLSDPRLPAARVADLVVVTGRPEAVVEELCLRRREGRLAALVAVDVPTFAGARPSPPSPGLLRAAAAGVPVAVVRAGEDLAEALAGAVARRSGSG